MEIWQRLYLVSVFFLPFVDFSLSRGKGAGIQISTTFLVLSGMAWVGRCAIRSDARIRLTRADKCLLLFMGIAFISVFLSYRVPEPFKGQNPYPRGVKQCAALGLGVLMYFLTARATRNARFVSQTIRIFLLSACCVVGLGLWELGNYYLPTRAFTQAFTILHNSPTFGRASEEYSSLDFHGYFPQLSVTFSEPSIVGTYFVIAIPLFLAVAMGRHFRIFRLPRSLRIVWSLLACVVALGSFSRGGIAAVLFVMLLFLCSVGEGGKTRVAVILLSLLILLGIVAVSFQFGLVSSVGGGTDVISNWTRLVNIVAALRMFRAYPFLGVGIGNYGFFYSEFLPDFAAGNREVAWLADPAEDIWPTTNSLPARVLAEMGLSGFLAFCLFLILLWRKSSRVQEHAGPGVSFVKALRIALVGSVILMFTHESFSLMYIWFLLGFLRGAPDAFGESENFTRRISRQRATQESGRVEYGSGGI